MALVALPPELRSICRRLTSTEVEQLPGLLPSLLKDVSRCQELLSRAQESKTSEASSDAAGLVHKLKTQITTLVNGRSLQGHFVGVALIKAVIENGGWECLRTSGPWVNGMISILQRKDPATTKELCIVTITKTYTLMQKYPTLVREVVTPTLPSFATACLQILKPPATSKAAKPPHSLIETVFEAISTLLPLYPTTLRQNAPKFRAEARPFVVPTSSDTLFVPASLQSSSRRLVVRLHMTAAKGGDSTQWTKHVEALLKTFHSTADQVFRAVQETWESTSGHTIQPGNCDAEPHGGGGNAEQYPSWSGVHAGSERMIGLLRFIADYLRCRTRTAVTIPVSMLVDAITRVSSIMPPRPGREKFGSMLPNVAIGREERDDLWTVLPDIQVAAMELALVMIRRLERNYIPLAQETLEQTLRMVRSTYRLPQSRTIAFRVTKEILCLIGPTLAKSTVDELTILVNACCRDLLAEAGHLKQPKEASAPSQNGTKTKPVSQNADAFLSNKSEDEMVAVCFGRDHVAAAEALLTTCFSHLPQQYISAQLRTQMLRTAILSRNKKAQVASVLHPVQEKSGRTPQVILPHLARQYPRDESVETLRFNFRPRVTGLGNGLVDADYDGVDDHHMALDAEDDEPVAKPTRNGFGFGRPPFGDSSFLNHQDAAEASTKAPEPTAPALARAVDTTATKSPFLPQPRLSEITEHVETVSVTQQQPGREEAAPLKRKSEDDDAAETAFRKRVELDQTVVSMTMSENDPVGSRSSGNSIALPKPSAGQDGAGDSSDGESVHLNMELDTSDDEDEEDEDDNDGEEEDEAKVVSEKAT